MILKKLGERIKQLRKEAGISQEKLAELAGLDRTYINSVENGSRIVLEGDDSFHFIEDKTGINLKDILEKQKFSI